MSGFLSNLVVGGTGTGSLQAGLLANHGSIPVNALVSETTRATGAELQLNALTQSLAATVATLASSNSSVTLPVLPNPYTTGSPIALAAGDSLLTAIEKLDGNIAINQTAIINEHSRAIAAEGLIVRTDGTNNTSAGPVTPAVIITAGGNTIFGSIANTSSTIQNTTIIGFNASATSNSAIAIGLSASVGSSSAGSTAIGNGAQATAGSTISIGGGTLASNTNAIAIGSGSTTASGTSSIAHGYNAVTNSDNSISIGTSAFSGTTSTADISIAIGNGAHSTVNSIAIGTGAKAATSGGIAIGQSSNAAISGVIAIGDQALYSNTSGLGSKTAIGTSSLTANTSGSYNTAIGTSTLPANTTGSYNTAIGTSSLNRNTASSYNTAIGYGAAQFTTTTSSGVMIGANAGCTADNGIAVGYNSGVGTGATNSIAIGYNTNALTNATNSIALGYNVNVSTANTIQLGNASIATFKCQVALTVVSDARTKTNIQENIPGINFINLLRPVTYNNDFNGIAKLNNILDIDRDLVTEAEQAKIMRTGFIAQEVEAAAKSINYDFNGVHVPPILPDGTIDGIYGISYSQFVVPLVQACKEQQVMINNLQLTISTLSSNYNNTVNGLMARLAALESK